MNKHFYLKLIYSKWTLIFTAVVIIMNLAASIFLIVEIPGVMPVINLANIFIIIYLTSNYMNVHVLMSYNKSHDFFMALPGNKKDIIRTDYHFHLFMTILSVLVIITYSLIQSEFHHLFGIVMITGVNLLIMSLYYILFTKDWFKNVNIKVVIYLVPMGFTFMFYYMPLINITEAGLDMPYFWDFILYILPYIILALGILAFVITYFVNQKRAVKNDVI